MAAADVTYVTPAQTEGPYYPVTKPADRDSDLVVVQGASGLAGGEVVELGGTLFDASGMPVAGAVVEIWQTDHNGVYAHPNDPRTSQRDTNFQFYGESITAEDGAYRFRTIIPGNYGNRAQHIHVKVKLNGRALLTTQFYFADDPRTASDSIFARLADKAALIIDLDERPGADGDPVRHGTRDIVLPP
jgi:protocatechuate 3,4-dioxygenase beta subunit